MFGRGKKNRQCDNSSSTVLALRLLCSDVLTVANQCSAVTQRSAL
jgi:hypothetical protein